MYLNSTMAKASTLFVLVFLFAFGSALSQDQGDDHKHDDSHDHDSEDQHADMQTNAAPLYSNLGDHGFEITTTSSAAQAYFDQGLRLQYAFNHAEAVRAYEKALEYDSNCAMCFWGIGLALGPNINAPMDEAAVPLALEAVAKATELSTYATAKEKKMIAALASRYDSNVDRADLDKVYMESMQGLRDEYSEDDDILTLYGASIMNLNPWNYWSGTYDDRVPNEGTEELLAALSTAIDIKNDNPGACHYYIHAVEAAYPERAMDCATRLADLMPGAGHIVHMPGHIYIRVGQYKRAVEANDHAVHSDETFIMDQNPMGVYPAAYYPHNYHFMAFAATMAGMSEKASEAAGIVAPKVPLEIAKLIPWIQNVTIFPQLMDLTFGDWEGVLNAEMPSTELTVATATSLYARGTAHAALGDYAAAKKDLAVLRAHTLNVDPDGEHSIFEIAKLSLEGEIALRSGKAKRAVDRFQKAADIEDGMNYEEPPLWYYPVRHSLGKALLEAGKPAQAEATYRYDLSRFRENGWGLFGLMQSLQAQGKDEEAKAVEERFKAAWADADIELTSSRF